MTNKSEITQQDVSLKKAKALSTISMVLLVLAIIFCATIILQVSTQGYVSILGFSVFRIATPSMEPTLPVNTFIISRKTDIRELNKDDIICFVSKEAYPFFVCIYRLLCHAFVFGVVWLCMAGVLAGGIDSFGNHEEAK